LHQVALMALGTKLTNAATEGRRYEHEFVDVKSVLASIGMRLLSFVFMGSFNVT